MRLHYPHPPVFETLPGDAVQRFLNDLAIISAKHGILCDFARVIPLGAGAAGYHVLPTGELSVVGAREYDRILAVADDLPSGTATAVLKFSATATERKLHERVRTADLCDGTDLSRWCSPSQRLLR